MRVGGNSVQVNRADVIADALEFAVTVQVADGETASLVCFDHLRGFLKDRLVRSIEDCSHRAVSHVARDGVQERQSLDKQKIDTQSYISMKLENRCWDWDSHERWDPGSCGGSRCFTLEACNVRSVDDEGASSVVRGDGTVVDVSAAKDGLEKGLVGASNFPVQLPSRVGGLDVSGREHLLLSSYRR